MSPNAFLRALRSALLTVLGTGLLVVFPAGLSLWAVRALDRPWALLVPLAVWVVTLAVWVRVFRVLAANVWTACWAKPSPESRWGRRKRYLQIDDSRVRAYQAIFDELVAATDAENLQRVRDGEPHLADVLAEDLALIDATAARASAAGLDPDYVRTMFEQWVWADPEVRGAARAQWVATVRRRRRNDFFPSARVVAERRELWARCAAVAVGVPA